MEGSRLDKDSETVTCEMSHLVRLEPDSLSASRFKMWISEITYSLALVPSV